MARYGSKEDGALPLTRRFKEFIREMSLRNLKNFTFILISMNLLC